MWYTQIESSESFKLLIQCKSNTNKVNKSSLFQSKTNKLISSVMIATQAKWKKNWKYYINKYICRLSCLKLDQKFFLHINAIYLFGLKNLKANITKILKCFLFSFYCMWFFSIRILSRHQHFVNKIFISTFENNLQYDLTFTYQLEKKKNNFRSIYSSPIEL